MKNDNRLSILLTMIIGCTLIMVCSAHAADGQLSFDVIKSRYSEVIISISLTDGSKVTRVTEPLPGRDGQSGMRKLKGYRLPDGTIVEKDIHRNSDGTLTIQDIDHDGTKIDRHPVRLTEAQFIKWVKDRGK